MKFAPTSYGQDDCSNNHNKRLQSVSVDHSSKTTWMESWESFNTSWQPQKHEISFIRYQFLSVFACLCTCNRVESSDYQHEDSGQVEVPSQTHLDKQGSRVQVSLGMRHNTRVSVYTDSGSFTVMKQSCETPVCCFLCVMLSYWYLCEDRQQQWEDGQVGSDPLSSKTTTQILRHCHNLNTHTHTQLNIFNAKATEEEQTDEASDFLWNLFISNYNGTVMLFSI